MQTHLTRLMISRISGCDIQSVAKVLQAARFLQNRYADTGVLDLNMDGVCSATPPTNGQHAKVEQEVCSILSSLESSLGTKDAAYAYLDALADPSSYLYSGDDEDADTAAKEAAMPNTRRPRRKRN